MTENAVRWLTFFCWLLAILIMFAVASRCQGDSGLVTTPGEHVVMRPRSKETPGVVRTTDRKSICSTATPTLRHVTQATKRKVFAEYGLKPDGAKYEVDHLISLEIGGTNDVANLWPQPYEDGTNIPGARQKDVLENKFHAMICAGTIAPAKAQKEIATDWYKAYRKYVTPKDVRLPR